MLTTTQIDRQLRSPDHGKLLQMLIDNGLPLPLPLRARLTQSPVPVLALALRRVTELTYGPTPLRTKLTRQLLQHQHPAGHFPSALGDGWSAADAPAADPLATAAAVAALEALLRDQPYPDATLEAARDRALAALAGLQADDGLFHHPDDRRLEDRALAAAFVLYLVGNAPAFRAAVRWADLLGWFDEHADTLDAATRNLHRLGCVTAVPATASAPQRRAVAA